MLRNLLVWFAAWTTVASVAGVASAQIDPESGDTGQAWAPPPGDTPPAEQPPAEEETPPAQQTQQTQQTQTQTQQTQQTQQQNTQGTGWGQSQQEQSGWFGGNNNGNNNGGGGDTEAPPTETPVAPGQNDHAAVVGSLGFTFFGVDNIVIEPPGVPGRDGMDHMSLYMPTVGIRYWVSEMVGLDVGVGVGVRSQEDVNTCLPPAGEGPDVNCEQTTQISGVSGGFGIRILAGLPIALAQKQHFNVLLAPEFSFGYGQATLFVPQSDASRPADELDVDLTGMNFDFGLRFGGEIQFGFWGLPNLSLQASIGLGFRYSQRKAANAVPGDMPTAIGLQTNEWGIRTIVDDLLNGTIRIIYYL